MLWRAFNPLSTFLSLVGGFTAPTPLRNKVSLVWSPCSGPFALQRDHLQAVFITQMVPLISERSKLKGPIKKDHLQRLFSPALTANISRKAVLSIGQLAKGILQMASAKRRFLA